ncbi:hypothetical protein P280DRAFT_197452 [Massarina eburnea CBS 473.64]|uniref:Uncharacterized protein n=1 Tax=Massarina eburnea CBS 473.64 TaxID=1395130 RepID=A0A6A6RJH7_9PLEO|nr:hypothetical protein P280DRAFT_197452 [Massarina eburnea CBS 473.64]
MATSQEGVQAEPTPLPNHLSFLELPGEIRNIIYDYTLNTHQPYQVPRRTGVPQNTGYKVYALNQQIFNESYSLMKYNATAYIPLLSGMAIDKIFTDICDEKWAQIPPVAVTLLQALRNWRNVHIHLHVPDLDLHTNRYLLQRLDSVMKILSAGKNSDPRKWGGKKKTVLLHLDHYFADNWKSEFSFLPSVVLFTIVRQMGKMDQVNWTIAYYIHAGTDNSPLSARWGVDRVNEFSELRRMRRDYNNINIRPEIYGEGEWKHLQFPPDFLDVVTNEISEASEQWPSYGVELHGEEGALRRAAARNAVN